MKTQPKHTLTEATPLAQRASMSLVLALSALLATNSFAQKRDTETASVRMVSERAAPWSCRFRFAKHMAKSHTIDVVKAPLSSTSRLLNFSTGSVTSWAKRADIRFRRTPLLNRKPICAIEANPGMDLIEWNAWLDQHVLLPETSGEMQHLIGGEAFFGRLSRAILAAKHSVLMQTYIFDNDDVAIQVADLMRDKQATVDVRVLYDGMGTIMAQGVTPTNALPQARPYSMHAYLTGDTSHVKARRIANRWFTGDHTKSTIIDHRIAFIGGMNIGHEYRHDWHDMMTELRGPVVAMVEELFESTWRRAARGDISRGSKIFREEDPSNSQNQGIHLLQTLPGRTEIADAQLEAIRRAQRYIYIENAYFSDDQIVHALCKARKRGVDVRVIIPSQGNHGIMQVGNKISINRLLKNGVAVYRYPGMSHIKAAVFDDWACFGTANFDKMSLMVNRELNLGTSSPQAVNDLLHYLFLPDMGKSTRMHDPIDITVLEHLTELLSDEA